MSSGHIPAKDEPDPNEIVEALREAVFENPPCLRLPFGGRCSRSSRGRRSTDAYVR